MPKVESASTPAAEYVTSTPSGTVIQVITSEEPAYSTTPDAPSTSASNSSLRGQRVCRICQSETGIMVRPCACAGTMGDMHEHCLNEWVVRSRTQSCEICKQSYARGSRRFKPFRQWTRPNPSFREGMALVALLSLLYSMYVICLVSQERLFLERVFEKRYPPRGTDVGRIVIFLFLSTLAATVSMILWRGFTGYLIRHRVVSFVDNAAHANHASHASHAK
uniref:RING-CH-type domain-containing protein n=1 Tax=Panagrellus redivivus TaxID=6233 RepID=A0A7E4UUW1_PANRE